MPDRLWRLEILETAVETIIDPCARGRKNGGSDEQCDYENPDKESTNREDKKQSREEDDAEHHQDKAKRSKSCDIDAPRAALVD